MITPDIVRALLVRILIRAALVIAWCAALGLAIWRLL